MDSKEELLPGELKWSPSPDQEGAPEPPHIKQEQEEVWSSQEGEQLDGHHNIEYPFAHISVKSEDDEEKPLSSQIHQRQIDQMETGVDAEDYAQVARNSHPNGYLHPETEDSCETEERDYSSVDTREHQFSLKSLINRFSETDKRRYPQEKRYSCSECGKLFSSNGNLERHITIHTGLKPFSCSVCGKIFARKGHVSRHMVIHTGEKSFYCSDCGQSFRCSVHLKRHVKTHIGAKPFSCSVCAKTYTHSKTLRRHMVVHTGERLFSCSICEQRFTWDSQLRRHMCSGRHSSQRHQNQTEKNRNTESQASSSTEQLDTEADGGEFGDAQPDRSSPTDAHLQPETEDHTEDSSKTDDSVYYSKDTRGQKLDSIKKYKENDRREVPFSCPVWDCVKQFALKANLKRHMRIHTGEKPFSCSVCEKTFTQKASLSRHMIVHTGEKPHSCGICSQRFTWNCQLKKHKCVGAQSSELDSGQSEENTEAESQASRLTDDLIIQVKEEQEELWTNQEGEQLQGLEETEIIEFPFNPVLVKSEDDEEKPLSSHPQQRPIQQMETDADGEDCRGAEYQTKDFSVPEYSDPYPIECTESQSGLMSLNKRVHEHASINTGEKPHSCSECGKRISGGLKRHMRTHTGEKPFSCSVCGERFTERGHVTRHMVIHTGEKRFSCSDCGKRFSSSTHLKRHMQIHTAEKLFNCSVCGKRFARKEHVTRHMVIHTGEKPITCKVCDQSFTWDTTFRKHKAVCHGASQLESQASSLVGQMEAGSDGGHCGGQQLCRNSSHPRTHLQPATEDNTEFLDIFQN